jgi:DNA-binding MltR family transcriptional regulator
MKKHIGDIEERWKPKGKAISGLIAKQQESDRGLVIIGAAHLEDSLEQLLRDCCLSDADSAKNVVDPLFRVYAPLSTFSSKINVAFAFGIINEKLYKALELIRKLRNDFAHESETVTFLTPKYAARLRALLNIVVSDPKERASIEGDELVLPGSGRIKIGAREIIDQVSFLHVLSITYGMMSAAHTFAVNVRNKQRNFAAILGHK